jgi:very-short-patch-repair endonuclease
MRVDFIREFAVTRTMVFDFYIASFNLLIECDGDYWHSKPGIKTRDAAKTRKALRLGYRVERMSESFIVNGDLASHLKGLLTQQSLL